MTSNYETGLEAAYAANEAFDNAVHSGDVIQRLYELVNVDLELRQLVLQSLSKELDTKREHLLLSCMMFRFDCDKATFFLHEQKEQPEAEADYSELVQFLGSLQIAADFGSRGYGSPTLDRLAEVHNLLN